MTEHFRYIFEPYIIGECDGRSKGVTGYMHRQLFLYPAEVGNLFQVGVHLLVSIDGQKCASFLAQRMILILFDYLQRIFEQWYIKLYICLFSLLAYLLTTVSILGDILGAEIVNIYIRKPRVTAEREYISHHFESLN